MTAVPLSREIYKKALKENVTSITLNWSGGSDQGYLEIDIKPNGSGELADAIDNWAWNVYDYSGAGCGHDYGDDITYDLKNGKIKTSEWVTEVNRSEEIEETIQIEEE